MLSPRNKSDGLEQIAHRVEEIAKRVDDIDARAAEERVAVLQKLVSMSHQIDLIQEGLIKTNADVHSTNQEVKLLRSRDRSGGAPDEGTMEQLDEVYMRIHNLENQQQETYDQIRDCDNNSRKVREHAEDIEADLQTSKGMVSRDLKRVASGAIKKDEQLTTKVWRKWAPEHREDSVDFDDERFDNGRSDHALVDPKATNYKLKKSVWDSCFLVGCAPIEHLASCVMIFALLLTIFFQAVFIWVIALLQGSGGYDDDMVGSFAVWNGNQDHACIVSQVCQGDWSRGDNYLQLSTHEESVRYVDEVFWIEQGPLVSAIMLFIWLLAVAWVVRSAFEFMVALGAFRNTDSSTGVIEGDLQRFKFGRVPTLRAVWGFVLCFLHILCAVVLMVFGALWLCKTTDIVDLFLICITLIFLLRVDEIIYLALASNQFQTVVRELEPLSHGRRPTWMPMCLPCRTLTTLFLVIVLWIVFLAAVILPHEVKVHDVLAALCNGR